MTILQAVPVLALLLCLPTLRAQSVCESGNGPLDPAQPSARTPAEIIQKFAANEGLFKAAKQKYGYVTDVSVETLNGNTPNGEYRQTSQIALDLFGKRTEQTTFAPQSSLRGMSLSEDDLLDIRTRLPLAVTPGELPRFSISYVGRQRVDQLDTYVFNVMPKDPKKGAKLFEGRIWVEDQDLAVVKTCGTPPGRQRKPEEGTGGTCTHICHFPRADRWEKLVHDLCTRRRIPQFPEIHGPSPRNN